MYFGYYDTNSRKSFATLTADEELDAIYQRDCSPLSVGLGLCKDDPNTPEFEHLHKDIGYYNPETKKIVPPANKRNGVQKNNCSRDCGSFVDPREWFCYIAKMGGGCGGSTGICDAFGAGEFCTKYFKFALIGGVGVIALILLKQFRVI